MAGAFLYLTWCSWRNRVEQRIRRLRETRYLVGLVVGGLYVYFFLFRPRGRGPGGAGALTGLLQYREPIQLAAACALFVMVALTWIWPGGFGTRPPILFSRADIQFLFPAPVTRRQLVRYKVLRAQFGGILGTLFMTLFLRPGSLSSGWTFFAGMLVLMAAVNLHFTGVLLRRQSLAQHRGAGLTRQWLPVAAAVTALAIVGGTIASDWSRLAALPGARAILDEAGRLLTHGAAGAVLWPFRTLASLPLSGTAPTFLRTLPLALAIVLANYFWVEQSDAAFEEAAATFAERMATAGPGSAAPAAPRVRAGSAPFALSFNGAPEIGIFWKNLILVGRYASLKSLARLVPLVVFLGVALSRGARTQGLAHVLGAVCVFGVAFAFLFGPMMARNDLRQDLANLALIRTWPIRGAAVVRGEVLAPVALLTSIVWLLILGATFLFAGAVSLGPFVLQRLSLSAAAMIVAPGILLTQIVVQNGVAVAFPAWVQIGPTRTRGLDVMGQRLVMVAGFLIVLALAVLPAAIAAAVVGFGIYRVTGILPMVVPAVVALIALVVESLLAIEAIGALFERTDAGAVPSTGNA